MDMPGGPRPDPGPDDPRDHLSSLRALLVLSALMTESGDEEQILHLTATSVPAFARCRVACLHLVDGGWQGPGSHRSSEGRAALLTQLSQLDRAGGSVAIPGADWAWAFALPGVRGPIGHLVVTADAEPSQSERFLIGVLAHHAGVTLANARLHALERSTADQLRSANAALNRTVAELEQATRIHDRFTRVAAAGEGQEGIAQAAHEVTGYPIAIEDRHGHLRAWAGPDRPDPYPQTPSALRERLIRAAIGQDRPVRDGDRLVVVAQPRGDVLGLLVLIDPHRTACEREQIALQHGGTVLALELARLQSLAETELRLRRDLFEDLLAGTDDESALLRGDAMGYDLRRRHRVAVVEASGRLPHGDSLLHSVRRAARVGAAPLVVTRGGTVVMISDENGPWEEFRQSLLADLGADDCSVGVGDWCALPSDIPRSHRQARLALRLGTAAREQGRATLFEDLGVYRLLSDDADPVTVERFVVRWLGPLIDYDSAKQADLVETLSAYLECGGSYDATASRLSVSRSTVRYRLQRIREISKRDLTDPDTAFHLQLATRALRTWQQLGARKAGHT